MSRLDLDTHLVGQHMYKHSQLEDPWVLLPHSVEAVSVPQVRKISKVGLPLHSFEEKHPDELLKTILPSDYVAFHV